MNRKKSILLLSFIFSPNIGGVESHLDDLCNYLIKKGYALTVITYKTPGQSIENDKKLNGITIHRIPWYYPSIFNALENSPILQTLYLVPAILLYSIGYCMKNRNSVDTIQVHGFNMAIVGAIVSLLFRKKLVVNTHVSFSFTQGTFYTKLLTKILSQASYILVLTKQARKELIKIGIVSSKIIVYHQWIDTTVFKPYATTISREKLKLPTRSFIILFVGRFSPAKGIEVLLKAAQKFDEKTKFIFVGSGPLGATITTAASKQTNIYFAGKVAYKDLPFYYSSADVTVIPSTPATNTYSEGIPRVMIESFTCGTPVIATKTGGITEHITNKTGRIIQPSSSAIVKAIQQIKSVRNKQQMKRSCMYYAEKTFDLSKNAKIIEKSLV